MNWQGDETLVVVDLQNDFCPGGTLAVPEGDRVIPIANKLADLFPHVILTQDWHPPQHLSFASAHPEKNPYDTIEVSYGPQILWPDHCVQGTRGADFHPQLQATRAELVLRKGFHPVIDSYSSFYENDGATSTGLAGYLRERNIRNLYFIGLATDFCVLYSTLDARQLGFNAWVIEDGVRGIDVDGSLEAAWCRMGEAGVQRIRSQAIANIQ